MVIFLKPEEKIDGETKAELLEMGISEEEIEENGGTAEQFGTTKNS